MTERPTPEEVAAGIARAAEVPNYPCEWCDSSGDRYFPGSGDPNGYWGDGSPGDLRGLLGRGHLSCWQEQGMTEDYDPKLLAEKIQDEQVSWWRAEKDSGPIHSVQY